MPFYDYQCPKCNHKQEFFHEINDNKVFVCGLCDIEMEKIIDFKRLSFNVSWRGIGDKEKDGKIYLSNEEISLEAKKNRENIVKSKEIALEKKIEKEAYRISNIGKQ